jgi:hypothetical protein
VSPEERIRAAVVASRRRQGLPEHVTDVRLLEELAAVIVEQREGGSDGRPAAE